MILIRCATISPRRNRRIFLFIFLRWSKRHLDYRASDSRRSLLFRGYVLASSVRRDIVFEACNHREICLRSRQAADCEKGVETRVVYILLFRVRTRIYTRRCVNISTYGAEVTKAFRTNPIPVRTVPDTV